MRYALLSSLTDHRVTFVARNCTALCTSGLARRHNHNAFMSADDACPANSPRSVSNSGGSEDSSTKGRGYLLYLHVAADHITIMFDSIARVVRHVKPYGGLIGRWLLGSFGSGLKMHPIATPATVAAAARYVPKLGL